MANEIKNENEAVVNAVSKTELFFNTYKKTISIVLLAIVAVVAGAYCYYKFSYIPTRNEAASQMVWAEQEFSNGNWESALEGDGNNLGFKQVIENYGRAASTSAYLYAAVCEMQKDSCDYEAALSYLNKFDGDDILNARAEALKGDIYCNQEKYEKAAGQFEKAAGIAENVFNAGYILKAAQCYEKLGKNEKALSCYEKIRDFYADAPEALEIDKYITRVKANIAE